MLRTVASVLLLGLLAAKPAPAAPAADYDLVIYGGTSAAVMAAVQAKKMGKSTIIVCPDKHLGGLSSGGLGWTDSGNKAVIGGLAREFYQRVWKHYDRPGAWTWQKPEDYGNKGQGTAAIDGAERTMWIFEPHVAEQVFEDFVREYQVPVHRDEWLDRDQGVKKSGGRVVSITMLSGKTYGGRMFLDATYEGDLMAAAGVSYHVGREANSDYGEQWNGVQTGVLHHRHHFGVLKEKISPYVVPGDPKSGVLPRVSTAPPGDYGQGDRKVQAYCYRYCVTDHPDNRIPFPKPDGYDPGQYELLLRIYQAGWKETFEKFDPIPNRKTDCNNHGPFSTDNIGMNYDYPEASYERRREILREHETYQKGWLYFIANDPRVPRDAQDEMRRWGLPKDEFKDNGGWPHQIYVREARRMVGLYVMTENDLLKKRPTPDSVGMGSYGIDSHNVQRYITPEGFVQNEGDIGVGLKAPYEIAYGALVPKKGQADNLLVAICVSSTHIAFGSIRMEPVFMILGQSAATAAALAMDAGMPVQDVPYPALRERLLKDGQVLQYPPRREAGPASRPNILFLFADDQRADTIAAHGNPHIQTPNLDKLAASGFSFRGNYVFGGNSGAVCVPSRAMLMSGRSWFNVDTGSLKGAKLLPELLQENGYATFGTGKWHNGQPSWLRAFQRGKAVMFGGMSDHTQVPVRDLGPDGMLTPERTGEKFSSELFADAAIEFLRDHDAKKPFFAYVAFTAPHDPRMPPLPFREMYYRNLPPLPVNFLPQLPFDNGMMKGGRDENLAAWPRTEAVIRDQLAEYYGLITHMDGQIGRILEALRQTGRADNTLVIFAADNGLALGSHGLLGKQNVFEHSMRVPLIIAGPRIPQGKSTSAFTYLLDLFPTLCDLLSLTPPPGLEGHSLRPLWEGKKERVRDSVFLPFIQIQRAVRDERWKLIAYPKISHLQLFDLQTDPHETTNLIDRAENAPHILRLQTLMRQWQARVGDTLETPTDNKPPGTIDLTGLKRQPDQWQPDWIRRKYFEAPQ